MKRIVTAALALLLFAGASQAQTTTQAQSEPKQHHHHGHHDWMKKLNLSADQKDKLKALHAERRKEMEGLKTGSLTADQMKASREQIHKKYAAQAQSIYTPEQKMQLDKMKAEWKSKAKDHMKGKEAHRNFSKELNLTQAQQDQLKQLRADSKSKFEALRNDKNLSDDQKKSKFHELRQQQHEQMKTVLTADQMEKMKSLRKDHEGRRGRHESNDAQSTR